MKWSNLSLGSQIRVIAVALAVLVTAVIGININILFTQNDEAWRENAETYHEEAVRITEDTLRQIRLTAESAANLSGLPEDSEGEQTDRILTELTELCPAALEIKVTAVSSDSRDTEEGFSDILRSATAEEGQVLFCAIGSRDGARKARIMLSPSELSLKLPKRPGVRIMVLDRRNRIAACSEERQIGYIYTPVSGDVFEDSSKVRYIQFVSVSQTDTFRVVTLVSGMGALRTRVEKILPINLAAILLLLLASSGCFYFLHATVTKPLEDMNDILAILGKRPEARISMRLTGSREMTELSRNFNRMMDENERLNTQLIDTTSRLYQAELIRRKTDMAMLVTQINPHFLYNTLEVIKGMAYRAGSRQIADMTRALGLIFRYSLKDPEIVSLSREAEVLRSYLMIQQTRFGDRFEVRYDLPQELMEQEVPKMILQPLCENAITHGLEMMEKGGILSVSARLSSGTLMLTVEDNGFGIQEDRLEEIRRNLDKVTDVTSLYETGTDAVGLVNVHGRIRMRYGENYGLTIASKEEEGTKVVISLPGRRPEDHV